MCAAQGPREQVMGIKKEFSIFPNNPTVFSVVDIQCVNRDGRPKRFRNILNFTREKRLRVPVIVVA